MLTAISPPRRHTGSSRWAILLVLLLLIAGGVLAYRYFFNRPGEAAIQLIPGDAMMAVTLDTNPSPQQVATFNRIRNAIHREQSDTQLDSFMTTMMQNSPVAKEIRPYVSNSMAFALLNASQPGSGGGSPDAVILLAISDPGKVADILGKYGQKNTQDGMDYFQFPKDNTSAAILGNYLALSDKPQALARLDQVRKGEAGSMAALEEYKQARAALPSDANLMVFVSPTALTKLQELSHSTGVNPLQNARWMAMGLTVRDNGLDMVWRIPSQMPAGVSQIAALNPELLKHLPSGAYGLMGFSQPGKYWDWINKSSNGNAQSQKMITDGVASFEKETGLSVPNDIVPGLTGDLVLAVYPDQDNPQSGVDGLIVIDDTNGADPAALADKVRAYVERASAEHGQPGLHFVSTPHDGATLWTLDDRSQDQVRHSLSSAAASPQPFVPSGPTYGNPNMPPMPNANGNVTYGNMGAGHVNFPDKAGMGVQQPDGSYVKVASATTTNPAMDNYLKNKSVVYAQVGKTILMASSQKMLDKAIAAYTGGKDTLADDPAYVAMRNAVPQGAQDLLLVNLPGIMNALRPTLARSMSPQSGITPDNIAQLFGSANGVVGTTTYDGKVATLTFFMPLDYERLIHLIHQSSGGATPPPAGNLQ